MWDPYAQFETAVLTNGLKVHCAHWPDRPWVQCGFVVRAGANEDPIGKEGLAHFVEHLVFQNAPMSISELNDFASDIGGDVTLGTTYFAATHYHFVVLNEQTHLLNLLNVFGHALLTSTLEKCIESERKIILAEHRFTFQNKSMYEFERIAKMILHPDSRRARAPHPIGTKEAVEVIQEEDLQAFYNAHYVPAKMEIVCIGALTLSQLVSLLNQSPFAMEKRSESAVRISPDMILSPLEATRTETVLEYTDQGAKEDKKQLRFRTLSRIPFSRFDGACRLFINGMHKLLTERIREAEQMAYDIHVSSEYVDGGYVCHISVNGLTPDSLEKFEKAIASVFADIPSQRLRFERLQRQMLLGELLGDMTGHAVLHKAMRDLCNHGRIISLTEQSDELRMATFEDVLQLLPLFKRKNRLTQLVYH